jgi:peptide chain release factor 3
VTVAASRRRDAGAAAKYSGAQRLTGWSWSVSAVFQSVPRCLAFEFDGVQINLLDTPGHKDFSEDTYRTLVAADCAVMVLDLANGVESQTEKLFNVCRLRRIPVITFVNKVDRPGKATLEVLEDIESKLGIVPVPVNWPLGTGFDFRGVIQLDTRQASIFETRDNVHRIAGRIQSLV